MCYQERNGSQIGSEKSSVYPANEALLEGATPLERERERERERENKRERESIS